MLDQKKLKTMSNIEPEPSFYDENGYGECENYFLYHATVSMLNIQFYIYQIIF